MPKYFHVSHGLRGCYLSDGEPYVIRCDSRRQLKQTISDEAGMIDPDGSLIGFSKKAIASFANECWQEAKKKHPAYLPYALPYKSRGERQYHNAIFVSVASRHDFVEYVNKENSDE